MINNSDMIEEARVINANDSFLEYLIFLAKVSNKKYDRMIVSNFVVDPVSDKSNNTRYLRVSTTVANNVMFSIPLNFSEEELSLLEDFSNTESIDNISFKSVSFTLSMYSKSLLYLLSYIILFKEKCANFEYYNNMKYVFNKSANVLDHMYKKFFKIDGEELYDKLMTFNFSETNLLLNSITDDLESHKIPEYSKIFSLLGSLVFSTFLSFYSVYAENAGIKRELMEEDVKVDVYKNIYDEFIESFSSEEQKFKIKFLLFNLYKFVKFSIVTSGVYINERYLRAGMLFGSFVAKDSVDNTEIFSILDFLSDIDEDLINSIITSKKLFNIDGINNIYKLGSRFITLVKESIIESSDGIAKNYVNNKFEKVIEPNMLSFVTYKYFNNKNTLNQFFEKSYFTNLFLYLNNIFTDKNSINPYTVDEVNLTNVNNLFLLLSILNLIYKNPTYLKSMDAGDIASLKSCIRIIDTWLCSAYSNWFIYKRIRKFDDIPYEDGGFVSQLKYVKREFDLLIAKFISFNEFMRMCGYDIDGIELIRKGNNIILKNLVSELYEINSDRYIEQKIYKRYSMPKKSIKEIISDINKNEFAIFYCFSNQLDVMEIFSYINSIPGIENPESEFFKNMHNTLKDLYLVYVEKYKKNISNNLTPQMLANTLINVDKTGMEEESYFLMEYLILYNIINSIFDKNVNGMLDIISPDYDHKIGIVNNLYNKIIYRSFYKNLQL